MSKHTEGPWRLDEEERGELAIWAPAVSEARFIAAIDATGYADDITAEQRANAQLIAAAPELLEWLRISRQILRGFPTAPTTVLRLDSFLQRLKDL